MDQYFWNVYKRLEHETLALADSIHVCDDQLKVYSERIGDLLVRASIEAEALVKVLYHANGGTKPGGKDLYFDTDCFGLLESKWVISKKTIYVTASSFYLQDERRIRGTGTFIHSLYTNKHNIFPQDSLSKCSLN